MAAIPTLYQGGAGLTGFTVIEGGFTDSGSALVPTNYSVHNTAIWNTDTFTETTNPDFGINHKLTVPAGLQDGAEVWLIYDYQDASNFRYVKIKIGALVIYSDLKNDEVSLWAVEGGVTRQVQGDTALESLQVTAGDLRYWKFLPGSALSITKVADQHLVKCCVTDSIANDTTFSQDMKILNEGDTPTTTVGKVGFSIRAGSTGTTVSKLQGGLLRAYRSSPSGNDGNAGTVASPFRTINQLYKTVQSGQIGIIDGAGGSYSESNLNITAGNTWNNGTSWEDACTFIAKAGTTINQLTGGGGYGYYVKCGVGFVKARYRVLCGPWIMQGTPGAMGFAATYLWGEAIGGADDTHKYLRFQSIQAQYMLKPQRLLEEVRYTGVAPFNVAPTAQDFEMYVHYLDVGGDNAGDSHGWYCDMSWMRFDCCTSDYSSKGAGTPEDGYGFHIRHGTINGPFGLGLYAVNNNRLHFCTARDTKNSAFVIGKGTNNWLVGCVAYEVGLTNTGGSNPNGFEVDTETTELFWVACKSWKNVKNGFNLVTYYNGTPDLEGIHHINCTSYGNARNYAITASSGSLVTDIVYMNCSAYAPVIANYSPNLGAGTVSNVQLLNNHETTDTGFKGANGVVGDPLFVDAPNGDFHLMSGSPLIGAGANASAYFDKDFERKPLPQGAWHIGAYAPVSPSTELSAIQRNRNRSFPQMNVFA